jgi:hypothetical protein
LFTAPACPSGFNPGEFAVQTCFLGRYGAEIGTDQFGAHIMMSAGSKATSASQQTVFGRFSNVEFYHVLHFY